MADCYLCGAYIHRGQGYRRNVQTGTSHRIYVGRRPGGSTGVQYGTRTLCHTCARIQDEQKSGGGLRALGFLGLCAVLLVLGFKAFTSEMPLVGLALWAAGPIAWAVVESSIKKQVAKRVWQEENQPYIPPQQAFSAPERAEAQDEDDGAAGMEALRGFFSAGDFRLGFSAIKDGESLTEWCERTAEAFPAASTISKQEIRDLLISAVQFRKPRAGEPVAVWFDETMERMREVSRSVSTDLFGPESGRRPDESNLQWLRRVGPLFLNVKDGESKDDVIDALAGIADQAPPNKGESVMVWFQRVRPLIDEYNARQDEAA
ncbi:hypothetical protein AZOA_25930 [Azoarcus sp. Aa7]|nr:hypothetical protein [Azoarcus sp. Aa7]